MKFNCHESFRMKSLVTKASETNLFSKSLSALTLQGNAGEAVCVFVWQKQTVCLSFEWT